MTNKKKKGSLSSSSSSSKRQAADTNGESTKQSPLKSGVLSFPQLTMLILLSIGASKLIEIRSAASADSKSACETYFGAEACSNASISTLLHFKFHYGVTVALLFFVGGLNCWNNTVQLAELNSLTIVSPILSGMAVLFAYVPVMAAQRQALIALVLLAILSPNSVPFVTHPRPSSSSSLPRMILAGLTFVSVLQTLGCAGTAGGVERAQALLPLDASYFPMEVSATTPIVLWIGLDTFLMALVYAYTWHSFAEGYQRVRGAVSTLLSRC